MGRGLCSSSRFGNKGFILSLDAAVAVFVVFIFLVVASFYVGRANDEPLSKLQMARTGYDLLALMDYESTLVGLNQSEVSADVKTLLPATYHMRVQINGTFLPGILTVESTTEPPGEQLIVGGSRNFVIANETSGEGTVDYFATANYWMWLR